MAPPQGSYNVVTYTTNCAGVFLLMHTGRGLPAWVPLLSYCEQWPFKKGQRRWESFQ